MDEFIPEPKCGLWVLCVALLLSGAALYGVVRLAAFLIRAVHIVGPR